ncbi:putative malate dehydrogenase 1B isoform X2 [Liolophura sinensis]|uniref:putative malate dehydrogenase 1B isoform X2 n=1 Tax=Liolophura sinensis TaxID=3198878 RepID=UPI0031583114
MPVYSARKNMDWLSETCQQRGWNHQKSPLIWRELIDRGGKGVLIGGANDFQEYASGYYGLSSDLLSSDMRKIAEENQQTKIEVDEEEKLLKSQSNPLHVCITNASSGVSYGMINTIAQGDVFGKTTEVSLHLLAADDRLDYLEGTEMEALDLAQGLLREVIVTSNTHQAFSDCSVILLLDEIPCEPDCEKSTWLQKNAEYFSNYAKIINEVAKPNVKVMLAGEGPVNFNVFMMLQNAPDIPRQNFVGLSRLTENHAKAIVSNQLKVNSDDVVDVIVWGNSYDAHYVDLSNARVHNYDGAVWGPPSFSRPVLEMLHDDKWVGEEFPSLVKQRKAEVQEKLGHPATMSRAAAITTMVGHWWNGSPSGQMFSLAVVSEGWYGVPEGLVFSYPVTLNPKGYWNVVQDINLTEPMKAKINDTVQDLLSEKYVMFPPPKAPTPPPTAEAVPSTDGGEADSVQFKSSEQLITLEESEKETSVTKDGEETAE